MIVPSGPKDKYCMKKKNNVVKYLHRLSSPYVSHGHVGQVKDIIYC